MLTLPLALAGLAQFRQFLLFKIVPGVPKARKIPVHPYSLAAVNAHDPSAWVDAQTACTIATALGAPYGVAFSLQRGNGLFFVDIDGAYRDGAWSPLATALCARFPGAAVEVSQSGTGLHIIGRGVAPDHGCKNIALGLELYTEDRFIALTGTHASGDANSDHTPALAPLVAEYFPPSLNERGEREDWTDGPCEGWRGPTDDTELIRRAMQSRSAASVFGGKAAFADLWQANEGPLAVSYPDEQRAYDASSADAALAQHLAFWTGKDCVRIERLMRQSALVRDKWERSDYLPDTITRAITLQRDVLADKAPEPVPHPEAPVILNEVKRVEGNTFLSPAEQMEFFKGCVYIYEAHRALTPGGHLLKPDQFKVRYGGFTFTMDDTNSRTSRDAWEAFTQSQSFRVPRADRTCFRPDQAPAHIEQDGSRTLANIWWPSGVTRVKGDPALFLRHVEKLLPNERDRRILLSYVAACVQHVGVKFQWCPLLQGVEGNGKSLISRCAAEAVGQRYTHWPVADKLGAQFNQWMLNKVLACVEDIYVPEQKKHIWEKLKPMITGEMQEIEAKGVDQDTRNVVVNFILNSNHKDAVRKTRNDRRLAIFYTAQQTAEDVERDMGGDYMSDIYGWLKGEGQWARYGRNYGYSVVAEYLHTYPIESEFNPAGAAHRAPKTSMTEEAMEASLGSVEQEVMEAIAQEVPGFKGGWISSMKLDELLARTHYDGRIPRNMRRQLLEGMGYGQHPGLRDGRVNSNVLPDAGKPRLFLKRTHLAWEMNGPSEIARAYTQAQM